MAIYLGKQKNLFGNNLDEILTSRYNHPYGDIGILFFGRWRKEAFI